MGIHPSQVDDGSEPPCDDIEVVVERRQKSIDEGIERRLVEPGLDDDTRRLGLLR